MKRVVLEIRIEELTPKALSYEEARLVAMVRDKERRRLIKFLLGSKI